MNFRKSIQVILFTAVLACIAGCKSDPTTPETAPSAPANLRVSELSATSGQLQWEPPADSANITGYRVWWLNGAMFDSVDLPPAPTHFNLVGLKPATPYIITMATRRGTLVSPTATFYWGGTTAVTVQGPPPAAVRGLVVQPISATSVGLHWTASSDTGAITYRAAWRSIVSGDSGSVKDLPQGTTSTTVSGLRAGEVYSFFVYAVRGGTPSSSVPVTSAGAMRYGSPTPIRLYETQSAVGSSGMVLDPDLGGPLPVSLKTGTLSSVQLAIYTSTSLGDTFYVGTAYSMIEYRNADMFDQHTFISDSMYFAPSLDSWYTYGSIDTHIPSDGNIRAFTRSALNPVGEGFYVRTGLPGSYHYARIFMKSVGGKILQGTAPNRFVELEISYQTTLNLPYAKAAAGGNPSPAVAGSRVRR